MDEMTEFIRGARLTVKRAEDSDKRLWPSAACLYSYIFDACDRLEQAGAEVKQLKEALQNAGDILHNTPRPLGLMAEFQHRIRKIDKNVEAACDIIDKSNKKTKF